MGTPEMDIDTPITNFYKDKSILITGSTGFIGTVLLEKILYSCSNVETIYVLIAPRNGQSAEERLQDLFQSERPFPCRCTVLIVMLAGSKENRTNQLAFQTIREMKIDVLKKVVAIEGDISMEDLGLSSYDVQRLQKEISVVFHVAASISFDLPVADTININTRATLRLLNLARGMGNLQVFVFVSTAYSNCRKDNDIVDEKVYDLPFSVESALYLLDCNPDYMAQYIKEYWPNAYTFSKALAEQIIAKEFVDLPVIIVRPSVVLSSMTSPSAGWLAGAVGPTPVLVLAARALLRVWRCAPRKLIDTVPADRLASFLLAAAALGPQRSESGDTSLQVYNYCSGLRKPITNYELYSRTDKYMHRNSKRSLIPKFLIMNCAPILYPILFFLLQTVPVYLIGAIGFIFRKDFGIMKIHKKVHKMVSLMQYFATRQFFLIDNRVRLLCARMHARDKLVFPCDVTDIDLEQFFQVYALGMRKYIMKENC